MSGDDLEQIEHFLGAYREDNDEELIANPIAYHWLTAGALRAALDELERLREYVAALDEAQVGLQTSAFYCGWLKGFKAMPTAGVYTQAHLDTVEYADELRALNADSAPQQPERGGEA